MNMMKRDVDTLIEAVRLFSKRGRKPLTDEEKALIERCEAIYEKAMVDHQKSVEYRNAFRNKKKKEDPLYARSKEEREKHSEAVARREAKENPVD